MAPRRSIFGSILFLRYSIAFIAGILLSDLIEYRSYFPYLLFAPAILILYINLQKDTSKPFYRLYAIAIGLLFVFAGMLYTSFFTQHRFNEQFPKEAIFTGRVIEKSLTSSGRSKYTIKLMGAVTNDSTYQLSETILLYPRTEQEENPLPCNIIVFSCRLNRIESNQNPGEFDYKRFMLNRGIRYQAYTKSEIEILSQKSYTLVSMALNLRSKLLNKYLNAGLKGNTFAVLAALTLGDKSYLDPTLKTTFASSGAMHVLAVSGLHVGIIYVILNFVLLPLNRKNARFLKIGLILILLWGYAFIAGLSPSVLRACTMFSLVAIGENIKRKTNIYNTLALSAFILTLINPYLIYEVGFQLSYSAVTSIVFFQPKIAALLKLQNKILKYLWELFAVSLAAQIGTFPISIFYFHQFPLYFWLSNFIVIPAAAILLYTAFLFFLTQLIPYFPLFLAKVLDLIVRFMNGAVSEIEQLPCAVLKNIWIDKVTVLLLVLIIIAIGWLSVKKRFKLLVSLLIVVILFISNALYNNIKTNRQQLIIFYNTYSGSLISLIDAKNHYYYTSSSGLNNFLENLLENTTGLFHTQKAMPVDSVKVAESNIRKYDHFLFFKNWTVYLNNEKDDNNLNIERDLEFCPNDSKIFIKKTGKMNFKVLKKGNLKSFTLSKESTFITREQGALIVFFKYEE